MVIIKYFFQIFVFLVLLSCNSNVEPVSVSINHHDTIENFKDTVSPSVSTKKLDSPIIQINDTLTELAELIAGTSQELKLFGEYTLSQHYKKYAENIEKKWRIFDSSKLKPIERFVSLEFLNQQNDSSIFYPFSGPDILYSSTLFSNSKRITMIGLEPVGSIPIMDDKNLTPDSIQQYCNKINQSLYAILNFSFFRTESMKEDLTNKEVDGTIHLLLLFLSRMGFKISSVKPFYIDTNGKQIFINNTLTLKQKKYKNPSIEIVGYKNKLTKIITYTSADLSNSGLSQNSGLHSYILNLIPKTTTYMKGASYLMHRSTFSRIRKLIIDNTNTIVQDDSGISIKYILKDRNKWEFKLYGNYIKPIPMFSEFYQPELDSLYKRIGAKPLGFGMGYNFRDKNSNFMIVNKLL